MNKYRITFVTKNHGIQIRSIEANTMHISMKICRRAMEQIFKGKIEFIKIEKEVQTQNGTYL